MLTLVIGNKNYSSWSMRPWLALKHTGVPFEEILVPLDRPETADQIARYSASGRVPVLIDGDLRVWESLAIVEYLAEKFPQAGLWPADPKARAVARSVCAEMHSGFTALRTHHTMNIRSSQPVTSVRDDVKADLARLSQLWTDARKKYGQGGPYLFGAFSNADAFFGPVATRIKTYALPLEGAAREYVEALWSSPPLKQLVEDARNEPLVVARYEPQK
jgi:glutathione S-transferase